MRLSKPASLTMAMSLAALAMPAAAEIDITAAQVGPDVVFSFDGTADFTELDIFTTSTGGTPGVFGTLSSFLIGPNTELNNNSTFTNFTVPAPFSTQGVTLADFGSGDSFGIIIFDGEMIVATDLDYVSGDTMAGSSTFSNSTFASLGLIEGTYTWSWGDGTANPDFVTLVIPAVPEPTGLLGAGLLTTLLLRRR